MAAEENLATRDGDFFPGGANDVPDHALACPMHTLQIAMIDLLSPVQDRKPLAAACDILHDVRGKNHDPGSCKLRKDQAEANPFEGIQACGRLIHNDDRAHAEEELGNACLRV